MAKENQKMQSWQVFHFARKHLGRSVLYSIFGKKNARTVDYWCENPKFTVKDEKAFDPIHGIKEMLEVLDDHGHTGVIRSCVKFICSGTTLDCGEILQVTETLPTISQEILADYKAVCSLQVAIDEHSDIEVVSMRKKAAIEEIERTYAKYMEVMG